MHTLSSCMPIRHIFCQAYPYIPAGISSLRFLGRSSDSSIHAPSQSCSSNGLLHISVSADTGLTAAGTVQDSHLIPLAGKIIAKIIFSHHLCKQWIIFLIIVTQHQTYIVYTEICGCVYTPLALVRTVKVKFHFVHTSELRHIPHRPFVRYLHRSI